MATNISTIQAYNVTGIGETRNLIDFVTHVNSEVNNFLVYGLMTGFFVVMFVSFKAYGWSNKASFAATSFISAILSTFFFLVGFMNETLMMATVIFAAGGVVALIFESREGSGL